MKLILLVGTGSFIGGIFRYLLSQLIQIKYMTTFPVGTFSINLLGSLLIGLFFGLSERSNLPVEWRLFIATGILGGFTTFSAFSNETVGMIKDGQFLYAGIYVLGSVFLSLIATFVGMSLVKFI